MTQIKLLLLGSFQALAGAEAITQIPTDKVRALWAYLAVEAARPHRRESLATLFWPDWSDADAKRNLRQSLHRLRHLLDTAVPHSSDTLLLITRQTIQLTPTAFYLDTTHFQTLLREVEQHRHHHLHRCPSCMARLEQAAELVRGEFLAGLILPDAPFFDEWLAIQRERLHSQHLHLLHALSAACLAQGDPARAYEYGARQVALEPWREEAHRQMMLALVRQERPSEALAQYATCCHILQTTLGLAPTAETVQLAAAIEAGTAALHALTPAPLHHFPTYFTPFWGREEEFAHIAAELGRGSCQLLTLVGSGGMGKTRLAVTAATRFAQQGFAADGLFFIPLAEVSTPSAVHLAIAQAVGLALIAVTDVSAELITFLHGKELLLVLDNFEQLAETSAWVQDWLTALPTLRLLITSRQPLNLPAESCLVVDGLAYPPTNSAEATTNWPAVALFNQCATQMRPDFAPHGQEEAIGRICQLVGGMPLALEMAATWVRLLTCAQIADQIATNLDLLVSNWPDTPDRHHSIRAIFQQTWVMLTPASQRLWAQLGVFAGGFGQEAAVAIAHASAENLAALTAQAILRGGARGRYEMHPLLRQFALANLGDDLLAHEQHARYYLTQLAGHEAAFYGEQSAEVRGRFVPDLDNVRQAWRWAAAHGAADLLQTSQRAFGRLWCQLGLYQEGIALLAEASHAVQASAPATAAHLHYREALLHLELKQYDLSRQRLEAAEAYWHSTAEPFHRLEAIANLGIIAWRCGQLEQAHHQLQHSLLLAHQTHHTEMVAYIQQHLGNLAWSQGDVPTAQSYLEQSLALYRAQGNLYRQAGNLNDLGAVYSVGRGELTEGAAYFSAALALYRQLGNELGQTLPLGNLGYIALIRADYATARQLFEEERVIGERLGMAGVLMGTLVNLGLTALLEPAPPNEPAALAQVHRQLVAGLKMATAVQEQQVMADALMCFVATAVRQRQWETAVRLASGTAAHFILLDGLEKQLYDAAVAQLRPLPHFATLWEQGSTQTLPELLKSTKYE